MNTKVALLILDGWGHGKDPKRSAIAQANTPFVNNLYKTYPNAELLTFGMDVGLPEGQMGNSEVGHMNIGAGRVVYQMLALINKSIQDKELEANQVLNGLLQYCISNNKPMHLMGLVSDGGVHSHIQHLKELIQIAHIKGVQHIYIHCFTDGRDVDPKSGIRFIKEISDFIKDKNAEIASVCGRYFAMDRDNRWERVKKAYDMLVNGVGERFESAESAILHSYASNITDEFVEPKIITKNNNPTAMIQAEDGVLCFNFRTDRCREITQVLTQQSNLEYNMNPLPLRYCTMTMYDETFSNIPVLFENDNLRNTLGEVLSINNKTQLRIAETEKYPHVTFFFSGGREEPFIGERRILVSSPKVATYDLQPEMSAYEITEKVIADMVQRSPDFICLNFANTDMVGHTGVFSAAMKAAETVDSCLEKIIPIAIEKSYSIVIIADHGNSDIMINEDGSPNTAHTMNMVPIIVISNQVKKIVNGRLADVATTILHLMQIKKPAEMTGNILVE